jgi:hypothetical protein
MERIHRKPDVVGIARVRLLTSVVPLLVACEQMPMDTTRVRSLAAEVNARYTDYMNALERRSATI